MIVVVSFAYAIDALAMAPSAQPTANSPRELTTSARLSSALIRVPITNPPCTAIVSHAVEDSVSENSAAIRKDAAVAENQRVIPRNRARASNATIRCGILPVYHGRECR